MSNLTNRDRRWLDACGIVWPEEPVVPGTIRQRLKAQLQAMVDRGEELNHAQRSIFKSLSRMTAAELATMVEGE
jgi:hypothetical protein